MKEPPLLHRATRDVVIVERERERGGERLSRCRSRVFCCSIDVQRRRKEKPFSVINREQTERRLNNLRATKAMLNELPHHERHDTWKIDVDEITNCIRKLQQARF